MTVRRVSVRWSDARRFLPVALALAAIALSGCARATAATQSGSITVSVPSVKIVASDSFTSSPIEKSTVSARVAFDPHTLTSERGVARLREQVLEAASKACLAALTDDYEGCVITTVHSAESQIDEAIARSRGGSTG